ncbi:hypothetical protein PIB30_033233 [Stylosanthes scabra]|uniref:CCHC-type domain-containing protein n=1 Tax=Stylosanthes scabra TaxID=79078 RepID=A0ABU6VEE8_9FABA|nr:hypothetical protein [Stylosanthes scabra]
MPCIHGIAAIRKKGQNPEEYVHPWLCMESIHATFRYSIHLVPSEQYWGNRNYLKTEAPFIKRPIGRPKVHNRKRDHVENLIEGSKLKRTFRVTCAKCGEQGHNYKTCKGPAANPGWRPKISRKRKGNGANTSNTVQEEVPLSQSAPTPEVPLGTSKDAPPPLVITAPVPFKFPAQVNPAPPSNRAFRAKQAIRRNSGGSSPQPSAPPTSSQPIANPIEAGPSAETMAAASAGTQRILRFMATPRLQKKKK